jgi:mannose-6-phosphate isomerase-like protein (cupin superfamily)
LVEQEPAHACHSRLHHRDRSCRFRLAGDHVTTLNVGQASHEPHRYPEEELMIVKEGTAETLQNGKASRLGPGSLIFHSTNDLHSIRNVESTPATYHVIQWRVAGAASGRASAQSALSACKDREINR